MMADCPQTTRRRDVPGKSRLARPAVPGRRLIAHEQSSAGIVSGDLSAVAQTSVKISVNVVTVWKFG